MKRAFFNAEYRPIARRGLTPIEAVEFMRREFPSVRHWTCWRPGFLQARQLSAVVGKGHDIKGQISDWRWTRVACSYPEVLFWDGSNAGANFGDGWVGILKVQGSNSNENFLLFSYLDCQGEVGHCYLASTPDVQLLNRFAKAVEKQFLSPDQLVVQVYGGPNFTLNVDEVETLFLSDQMRADIEGQVHSFFAQAALYKQLQIRHRRGMLFVGSGGNGKTLLLRHLIRQCHRQFKTGTHLLNAGKNTADYELITLFQEAYRTSPSLVIIEDIDSLLTESGTSRATVLAQLDGVESRDGVLFIATTNHPESIDSAFTHRPSRFDRVWNFQLPDLELRRRYLAWALTGMSDDLVDNMARKTEGWSFAYLNELRTTAVILSLDRQNPAITGEDVARAFALLTPQFQNGRKHHVLAEVGTTTGFRPE
jgi:hypothetical protein